MSGQSSKSLDKIDLGILKILQEDCRIPLEQIAEKLEAPKSTIHYRIKRLEEEGIIEGYYAKVNFEKLGKDYLTVTLVRAKYGPGYHEKVGHRLSEIPGVWGVYFIFGENDFIILTRSKDREDYMRKLETITNMPEIERTNTQVVAKVIKEDVRGGLDI
ncbi:MAG: Lrp/AsnC family transcriptional regulator [Candidatus Bathyarchaeia archaeon]